MAEYSDEILEAERRKHQRRADVIAFILTIPLSIALVGLSIWVYRSEGFDDLVRPETPVQDMLILFGTVALVQLLVWRVAMLVSFFWERIGRYSDANDV
jgi:hypothetical protein